MERLAGSCPGAPTPETAVGSAAAATVPSCPLLSSCHHFLPTRLGESFLP